VCGVGDIHASVALTEGRAPLFSFVEVPGCVQECPVRNHEEKEFLPVLGMEVLSVSWQASSTVSEFSVNSNKRICICSLIRRTLWRVAVVRLEKLIFFQLVILSFYGTRNFNTVFTRPTPLPMVPVPSQMNLVHAKPPWSCKVYFNIILPSTSRSSKWILHVDKLKIYATIGMW
jgi:hypothetical protein